MTKTELRHQAAKCSYTIPEEAMTECGLNYEPQLHAYLGENSMALVPAVMTSIEVVNALALFSQMVELLTERLEESEVAKFETPTIQQQLKKSIAKQAMQKWQKIRQEH